MNRSITLQKITEFSPDKKSHDGHKISMEDCQPSPNKSKLHHKSQSDNSADIINLGLNDPINALIIPEEPLEDVFTFDKSKTGQTSPHIELNIEMGSGTSIRSKSTPGATKLHVITPMSPSFL